MKDKSIKRIFSCLFCSTIIMLVVTLILFKNFLRAENYYSEINSVLINIKSILLPLTEGNKVIKILHGLIVGILSIILILYELSVLITISVVIIEIVLLIVIHKCKKNNSIKLFNTFSILMILLNGLYSISVISIDITSGITLISSIIVLIISIIVICIILTEFIRAKVVKH